ncbi:MAG: F0F1 ATP synthase subunit A [Candidatus Saccharimonadales bacterium]
MISLFADSGPAIHVAPGGVFHIGSWVITNSILYGWVASAILTILLVWTARRVIVKPRGGFVQFVEAGVEFIRNLVENAFDDKRIARKYVPYFVTLFFFILFNTWFGLLPVVGDGFHSGDTPLFRPFTGDLNSTFAMAIVTMVVVYTASIRESGGLKKYIKHFFVGSPKNPLYLIIALLEMFTDLTRVVSLSLRLFLNVAIGEMVIAVFSYLGHFAAPLTALPFTLIELGVGALQSYIFVILGVMYLAIAVNHANHDTAHGEKDHLTEDEQPETIGLAPGSARG